MQSLGLVLAGFLIGIIVTNLDLGTKSDSSIAKSPSRLGGSEYGEYQRVAKTAVWDVLTEATGEGRSIVLAQNGYARVVVIDDKTALHVMTYKSDDPVWQGRLMDVGNDGTVEVADISFGRCEAFN